MFPAPEPVFNTNFCRATKRAGAPLAHGYGTPAVAEAGAHGGVKPPAMQGEAPELVITIPAPPCPLLAVQVMAVGLVKIWNWEKPPEKPYSQTLDSTYACPRSIMIHGQLSAPPVHPATVRNGLPLCTSVPSTAWAAAYLAAPSATDEAVAGRPSARFRPAAWVGVLHPLPVKPSRQAHTPLSITPPAEQVLDCCIRRRRSAPPMPATSGCFGPPAVARSPLPLRGDCAASTPSVTLVASLA